MKIQFLSDIHLEFGPLTLAEPGADVLVLAGDFANKCAEKPMRFFDWLDGELGWFEQRPEIVMVLGNHDFYGCRLEDIATFRAEAEARPGMHLLNNETIEILGVRFIGSTLWADFCLWDNAKRRFAMHEAENGITDFRAIRHGKDFKKFKPTDAVALHQTAVKFIATELAKPFAGKTVVVTHFAPHPGSVAAQWKDDVLTPYFVNDITKRGLLISDETSPDLWIHGHSHWVFDYQVGKTRIVGNARGYDGRENIRGFDPAKMVEL
jgi:predicted phosphodiesterase